MIINNLTKTFGTLKVLDNLNLVIPNNSITCINAPSGYGKTTLINIISGIIKPDKGEVTDIPHPISMVFQEDRLLPWFSAIENISIVSSLEKATEYLQKVGLSDFSNTPIAQLSGGMQRLVTIARALSVNYELLILDEPFKGLDAETKEKIIDLIKKELGSRTCILITHNIQEAANLADNIIDF